MPSPYVIHLSDVLGINLNGLSETDSEERIQEAIQELQIELERTQVELTNALLTVGRLYYGGSSS